MENYSSTLTIICGAGFVLGGLWAFLLARWNLGKTKLEDFGLLKLSPRTNKIITILLWIILIIFGILMVRFGITNPTLP